MLKLNLNCLRSCKTRTPIKLSLLRKISDFLTENGFEEFSMENLERHVDFVKGSTTEIKINKPKFPINFATKEGVRIISKFYHDGGINFKREHFYSNKSELLIQEFSNDIESIFGKIKLRRYENYKGIKIALPRIAGDILKTAGCYVGDKVLNNPSPPNWILNLNKNLIKEFIRSAMDDEGCVSSDKTIIFSISIKVTHLLSKNTLQTLLNLSKSERIQFLKNFIKDGKHEFASNILEFDKKLIEKLEIKANESRISGCYFDQYNREIMISWVFTISSIENLLRFYTLIGFKLDYKNQNLTNILKNYRYKLDKIDQFLSKTSIRS